MSHVERFAMSTVLISHMMTVKQKKKEKKKTNVEFYLIISLVITPWCSAISRTEI